MLCFVIGVAELCTVFVRSSGLMLLVWSGSVDVDSKLIG